MRCDDCERFASFRPKVSIPSSTLEVPRLHQFPKAQQLVLDGDADLECYAAEIRRLQSKILLIEQKRSRLNGYLEHYRSLAAPLWKIPDEVLGLIFGYLCDGHAKLQKIGIDKPSIPVLRLSAVCSHWQSVLHSTPSLWSNFVVSFTAGGMPAFDAVKLFLERSKDVKLRVKVTFDHRGSSLRLQKMTSHPAFLALASQAHRWETLHLFGKRPEDMCILRPPFISSCPELRELRLSHFRKRENVVALDFAPMPKLTCFLAEYFHALDPAQSLPWHQLNVLKVNAKHDVPRLVELCENLRELIVDIDPRRMVRTYLPILHLLFSNPSNPAGPEADVVQKLLDALSFPSLTELDLSNFTDNDVISCTGSILVAFIEKCSSTLEYLTLENICVSDTDLLTILHKIPDPSSTKVACPLSTTFIENLSVLPQSTNPDSPILLPNLLGLYLTIRKEFDETGFTDMIISRSCISDIDKGACDLGSFEKLKLIVTAGEPVSIRKD
ncbi:hypothetical protein BT96DRAFT_924996 [Gymnopus androsaceus JB14]|uniref:F-box domain-containing protein n=1 Tax=Gymnopus androsaceus JB14 TaxID=1447944 RepID=A0A6A4H2Q1_9AGAR|nr:hypothetical protein BT96DRAFT_924996 [Gymnopus androsaceus JB14]